MCVSSRGTGSADFIITLKHFSPRNMALGANGQTRMQATIHKQSRLRTVANGTMNCTLLAIEKCPKSREFLFSL